MNRQEIYDYIILLRLDFYFEIASRTREQRPPCQEGFLFQVLSQSAWKIKYDWQKSIFRRNRKKTNFSFNLESFVGRRGRHVGKLFVVQGCNLDFSQFLAYKKNTFKNCVFQTIYKLPYQEIWRGNSQLLRLSHEEYLNITSALDVQYLFWTMLVYLSHFLILLLKWVLGDIKSEEKNQTF